jgi:NitT/TauT family transport system ATP-binding protein
MVTTDPDVAILALDISKSFNTSRGDSIEAIQSVTFEVHEGEFLSIVGHSGCGKSTLLKIISGLVAPTSGSMTVFGKTVTSPLGNVGFVFQNPLLMPWRTALENLMLPVELLNLDDKEYHARATRLIETVGLEGFEELYPRELSGGMQQRVALARALINDPPILLMDEPFGSLDELTREEMAIELLRVTEEMKKTVVFVTHSVSEAVLLGDRVLVLSPRPSTVVKDLRISTPRPRDSSMRTSVQYLDYCESVRTSLGLVWAK